MSAEATPATFDELEQEPNGFDLDTMEPITHNHDRVGETVLAICTTCSTERSRRLLERDYDDEDDFKQSLVEGDDDYMPSTLWRRCDECGRNETHFVC
ncbi:MAG: hypothetical protein ACOCR6_03385 [archaeon]